MCYLKYRMQYNHGEKTGIEIVCYDSQYLSLSASQTVTVPEQEQIMMEKYN